MAVKISFRLKEPQSDIKPSKQKETLVFMFFNYGYYEHDTNGKKKYIPLKLSTGEMILPRYWNEEDQRARQVSTFDYIGFNRRLDDIENCSKKVHRDLINEGLKPNPSYLKEKINAELKGIVPDSMHLNTYIDKYIQGMNTGERITQQGTRFRPLTIKNYKGFQSQFNEFQETKGRQLNYADITLDFYDEFIEFFNEKNYSPNTIGRHVKILKTIMRAAREEGHHDNMEIERRKFKAMKVDVQNVYLTEAEVEAIRTLDLSDKPSLDIARDVFLVGCYTAQRYSDYSTIRKENIRYSGQGVQIIDLIQQKTRENVIIPIKPELLAILRKYDFNPPKTHEQKLNERIKKVAELAGINELIPVESIKGGITVMKDVPKYDLIKTHTARRTGCTNMYLAGIPTLDIMKISGHKTEREFLKYIKVGKEETATNLANHSYFQTNLKVI
jgi:integrase